MKATLTSDASVFDRLARIIREEGRKSTTELAKQQVKNQKKRAAQTLGLNDSPMPSLSEPYRQRKQRQGRRPVRDLRLSGQLLKDLHAGPARKKGKGWVATISFRTARSTQIAVYNQARSPWFGVSPKDKQALLQTAQKLLEHIKARFR